MPVFEGGQAHDAAQGGGLAGAVPSQQADQFAAFHVQRHVEEDVARPVIGIDPRDVQYHSSSPR